MLTIKFFLKLLLLKYTTQSHKWVEFVVFLLCSKRFFSGYSGFTFLKNECLILFSETDYIYMFSVAN